MRKKFRLFGAGAVTAGAMAGLAALTLPPTVAAGSAGHTLPQTVVAARTAHTLPHAGEAPTAITAEPSTSAQPTKAKGWRPLTHGLDESPAELLPEHISRSLPVRVVSTTVADDGGPVITARPATDANEATKLVRAAQQAPGAVGVELDSAVRAADAPTGADPLRYLQWDLGRIGAPAAWSQSTGAGVTVAVVDTGVDSSHPDLAGQVLPGGDFITGTEGPAIDPNGHGTHVAGTIAAIAGNDVGVAGIAPDAKILPVRVLGANGGGYMSTAAQGVVYAAEHGAEVINLSLSATTPTSAMANAIAYARSRNVVVVAAAGNSRAQGSPVAYPAADDGVIAVAATDSADNPSSFSNRGGYVDVAAPGTGIVSTYPAIKGDSYMRMNGTSMAAPHVAAVAALIRAKYPALGPDQVQAALESSAVDLGPAGRDDDFGAGLIDASATLTALAPRETPTPPTSAETPAPAESPAPGTAPPAESPAPGTAPPAESPPPADSPAPAKTPAPADTPAPTETPVAQKPAVLPMIVRTAPRQLTVAIRGAEGQLVEVQKNTGDGWETIHSYQAVLVVRLNDLTPGVPYRAVVADSPGYRGATSNAVLM